MAKSRKRPTIIEIAREAGVSPTTVSRVINDNGYPVKAETRKRVEQAIKQHRYKLNIFGKGLSGKSNVIGIHVCVRLSVDANFSQSVAKIIDGIKSVTRERGFHVFLNVADGDAREESQDLFAGVPLAGMLVVAPRKDDPSIPLLLQWETPFVIIGSSGYAECHYVDGDHEWGGRMAVRHLYEAGRRRIAYLGGPVNYEPSLMRVRAHRAELERLELPQNPGWVIHADPSLTAGYQATLQLLALKERPDAICCYNDVLAAGAVRAARRLGFLVPQDLAVMGYDNSHVGTLVDPQLSSFHHDDYAIAAAAARMLLDEIIPAPGPVTPPRQVLFKPRLVVRQSCGAQLDAPTDYEGPPL